MNRCVFQCLMFLESCPVQSEGFIAFSVDSGQYLFMEVSTSPRALLHCIFHTPTGEKRKPCDRKSHLSHSGSIKCVATSLFCRFTHCELKQLSRSITRLTTGAAALCWSRATKLEDWSTSTTGQRESQSFCVFPKTSHGMIICVWLWLRNYVLLIL